LELVNVFVKNIQLKKFSLLILLLGVIGGIVSVLTGNQSYQLLLINPSITQFHYNIIHNHEFYASITIWYFLGILIYQAYVFIKKKNEARLRYLFVIFVIVGAIFLYMTASIGGKLVYDYGIGTNLIK